MSAFGDNNVTFWFVVLRDSLAKPKLRDDIDVYCLEIIV
jgi:hypothetical protein